MSLPPDVSYCIDSAVELQLLTADVAFYLSYYKPDVVQWFDDNGRNFEKLGTQEFLEFRENRATLLQRSVMSYQALKTIVRYSAYENCLGVAGDFVHADEELIPTRENLLPFFDKGATQDRFNKNLSDVIERARTDLFNGITLQEINQEIGNIYRNERTLTDGLYYDETTGTVKRLKPNNKKKRKAILKSLDFLARVAGSKTKEVFLGGDYITISGNHFVFKIRKGNYSDFGHSSLDIELWNRRNQRLSNLCFYYENMPAADQLASMMIEITAGNEMKIIETANCWSVTDHGRKSRILKKMGKIRKIETTPPLLVGEKSYFFKVEKYRDQAIDIAREIMIERMNKVVEPFLMFDRSLSEHVLLNR